MNCLSLRNLNIRITFYLWQQGLDSNLASRRQESAVLPAADIITQTEYTRVLFLTELGVILNLSTNLFSLSLAYLPI